MFRKFFCILSLAWLVVLTSCGDGSEHSGEGNFGDNAVGLRGLTNIVWTGSFQSGSENTKNLTTHEIIFEFRKDGKFVLTNKADPKSKVEGTYIDYPAHKRLVLRINNFKPSGAFGFTSAVNSFEYSIHDNELIIENSQIKFLLKVGDGSTLKDSGEFASLRGVWRCNDLSGVQVMRLTFLDADFAGEITSRHQPQQKPVLIFGDTVRRVANSVVDNKMEYFALTVKQSSIGSLVGMRFDAEFQNDVIKLEQRVQNPTDAKSVFNCRKA
jgi:hypothetical protein